MAIVAMTDAVFNGIASSSEYNKLIDNIQDLDARLGPVVSGSNANTRLNALEANSAGTRLTALESLTTNTSGNVGIGNQRLSDRLGSGVSNTTNVTTGTATAQLTDLRTRMAAAESEVGANVDAAYIYQSVAQVIAQGTPVTMTQELFDTNTMHDTVTNTSRITIKKAGVYQLSGALFLAGGGLAASRRVCWIAKNGTAIQGLQNSVPPSANAAWNLPVPAPSAPVQLAVNDYIELYGYWGTEDTVITGSNRLTVVTGGYNSFLSAVYLRP